MADKRKESLPLWKSRQLQVNAKFTKMAVKIKSKIWINRTRPPIQWVLGVLSRGVKRPGREADHSPPSRAK